MRRSVTVWGFTVCFLLATGLVSLAGEGPYGLTDNGELLPRIARGLEKPTWGDVTAIDGPTTTIQAGVARTGATYCDGVWQGSSTWYRPDWYYGDEFYAVYQDPESAGSCAGFPDVYTFDVTSIKWVVYALQPGISYDMQPLVYANTGDGICDAPGEVLCAGPLYAIDLPTIQGYVIDLPIPDECCVYDDYFAGVYSGPFVGPGYLGVVLDDGVTVPPTSCRAYNDYGGGWRDLVDDEGFPYNFELWSVGTTWDQNACPGKPADYCITQSVHGSPSMSWTDPDGNQATDRWAQFTVECHPCEVCTLTTARIGLNGAYTQGTPTMRVRVYGSNDQVVNGWHHPADNSNPPGTDPNLLGEVDVPFANLQFHPQLTTVDLQSIPGWPGGIPFAPGERFYISVSLSPNTPSPGVDVLSVLSDDGFGHTWGYSGAYYGVVSAYLTTYEAFGTDYNWIIEAGLCCVEGDHTPDPCELVGSDDWNTWAHDYERTCHSNLDVGDPCSLTPVWTQPLYGPNSFCEPTIADGLVYVSTDRKLCVFDLPTGGPGNCIYGLPHIFSSNRGNVTIQDGRVYVTGGNAGSIEQWNAPLSNDYWGVPGGCNVCPPIGLIRFGVTAVYDIGGTEVVVVGTENSGGSGGRLWCFETASGAIYPGWPSNPRVLPQGIWHSPSYDGATLYVGTSSSNLDNGRIYSIDPATGAINWTHTPADANNSFPGGVSVEGEYVYAVSSKPDQTGIRVKLDKTNGDVIWEYDEQRALYGVPAIGQNFLFINQDGIGGGVLIVDKNTGVALYNFAADGVGQVSQPVTLTCDNYLFAGDRTGKWWLLDVPNQHAVQNVLFNGIVNGTALATDPSGGDYAVVSIRSGNSVDGGGYVAAFQFNAAVQPHVVQNTQSVDVHILPGTGSGNAYVLTDALENTGCADLHVTSYSINDPAPNDASQSFRDTQARYAASLASRLVGDDYTAYFDETSKEAMLAKRMTETVNGELTRGDVALEKAAKVLTESKRGAQRLAASGELVRTSDVTYTPTLLPGDMTDVSWVYDGTGLARGLDVEEIELITDDPNRVLFGNQPLISVHYIGGCLPDITSIVWNTLGAENQEKFTNTGRLGDDDESTNLSWGTDPNGASNNQLFDGSFFVAGPVPPDGNNAQFYMGNIYGDYPGLLLADVRPSDNQCAFDAATDVHMGWKRTGGCPGTPEEIKGAWVRSYFIDSNATLGGTPYAAIGLKITQTEIGAYDPLFGDFSLIKWDLTERNGESENPVYAGTWTDWDVHPGVAHNHGIVSDVFNGYALWDWVTPTIAYGFLDPRMPTDYCGVNPGPYSPHRIQEMGQYCDPGAPDLDLCGGYGLWQNSGTTDYALLWESVVNGPARESGPHFNYPVLWADDHFGLLVNKGLNIGPYETRSVVQAKFAVPVDDVGSEELTDVATVEERCAELARRAAIWSGYARGDVNMDGCVNLIDVCWLSSNVFNHTPQIYPDDYNGDVDLSGNVDPLDPLYLLVYITGLGPPPPGAWRFTF